MYSASIAPFPEFSKLHLSHKRQLVHITSKFQPYSDFNFTSLFSWGLGVAEVSILHGNLVIKLPDYTDGQLVYSILGQHEIDMSIHTLLGITDKLNLVPEVVVEKIKDRSYLEINEDRDNFDYMYEIEELSKLAGARYKKIRNKSNKFRKAHEDRKLDIKVLNSIDHYHAHLIEQINEKWADGTGRESRDLQEKAALKNLLNHASEFDLVLTLIEVDEEVKAFSINEILNNGYVICHFEKALREHHEAIYTFLTCQVAEQLMLTESKWVNWEQDLGIEGLRKAKLTYHPSSMLKKYSISSN
jgi:hypothetical protein